MAKTAAELIAHLEAGGLIARGDPAHIEFVRFEIYDWQGTTQKHLGCYGWGSALGRTEKRLVDVLYAPHEWVCIPIIEGSSNGDNEAAARPLLEALGRYVDYEWRVTATDERKRNVNTEKAA